MKVDNVYHILDIAERFNAPHLKAVASGILGNNAHGFLFSSAGANSLASLNDVLDSTVSQMLTVRNVCNVLSLADEHKAGRIKRLAIEFMHKNIQSVMNTEGWKSLVTEEPNLVVDFLLRRYDQPQNEAEQLEHASLDKQSSSSSSKSPDQKPQKQKLFWGKRSSSST